MDNKEDFKKEYVNDYATENAWDTGWKERINCVNVMLIALSGLG